MEVSVEVREAGKAACKLVNVEDTAVVKSGTFPLWYSVLAPFIVLHSNTTRHLTHSHRVLQNQCSLPFQALQTSTLKHR